MALADKTSRAQISGELVDAAAHELGWAPLLRDKRPSGSIHLEMPQERDEPFTFQSGDGDTNEVLGQTFLNYHHTEPRHWLRGQRDRSAVRIFLLLIFLGAAFLWLRDQFDGFTLTPWNDRSTSSSGSSQLPAPAPKSNSEPPLTTAQVEPAQPPANNQASPQIIEPEPNRTASLPDSKDDGGQAPLPEQTQRPIADKPKPPAKNALPARSERRISENPEIRNKQLEMEIYKAIGNRAIIGVAVSVSNGTAYLEGRVATERQKRAAEQAARSVEGIERVQSRILVS